MKKYEKPVAYALNGAASVEGGTDQCASGKFPTEGCSTGYTNVGPCDPTGFTAGRDCTGGLVASAPTSCIPGTVVTFCTDGKVAAKRRPQH